MRYIINISFKAYGVDNIVEKVKTLVEAKSYESIIDDTVSRALIKDNVTNNVIWLKK